MKPLMRDICRCAAEFYGIDITDLVGNSHKRRFARPRQVCMYLGRALSGRTLHEIKDYLGIHHTTVIHGFGAVAAILVIDDKFLAEVVTVAAMASAATADRYAIELEAARRLRTNATPIVVHLAPRRVCVPERSRRGPQRPMVMPTELSQPTKARLMGRRA